MNLTFSQPHRTPTTTHPRQPLPATASPMTAFFLLALATEGLALLLLANLPKTHPQLVPAHGLRSEDRSELEANLMPSHPTTPPQAAVPLPTAKSTPKAKAYTPQQELAAATTTPIPKPQPPPPPPPAAPEQSHDSGESAEPSSGFGLAMRDERARALHTPLPHLPRNFQYQELSVSAALDFWIAADGSLKVSLAKSSGFSELDQLALAKAQQWVFKPAKHQGQPVASKMRVQIDFEVQ